MNLNNYLNDKYFDDKYFDRIGKELSRFILKGNPDISKVDFTRRVKKMMEYRLCFDAHSLMINDSIKSLENDMIESLKNEI